MDYGASFNAILENFKASTDADRVKELAKAFHKFQNDLEDAVLREGLARNSEVRKGSQSRQFMQQILPTIQKYMRTFPKGHKFTILDIGPGTGFGAQLLAANYQTMELGYTARVTTTDLFDDYADFMRLFCRYVSVRTDNIFDITDTFDIVIASHVIEHVPEWQEFARQMQRLATGIAIVCAPYNENPNKLTKGHVNIINGEFIAALAPTHVEYVESPAWGLFEDPRYKMFIATLPGLAEPV